MVLGFSSSVEASERAAARVGWTACGLSAVLAGAGVALHVVNRAAPSVDRNGWWAAGFAASVGFAVSGALVASRRRSNPIGWLLLGLAVTGAVDLFALEYGIYALATRHGSLGGGALSLWVASWAWTFSGLMLLVFLLFPDGRLLSRRWRPVAALAIALPVAHVLGHAVYAGPIREPRHDSFPMVDNPLGIPGAKHVLGLLAAGSIPLVFATILAALAALVLRFRRAAGDERQQLKWITYAGGAMGVQFIVGSAAGQGAWEVLSPIAIALFAAAMAAALLRYRLYDIDVIINRTLVYGALTACVVAAYAGAVALVGVLVPQLAASLLATALVALLFAPLRVRLQRGVDRLLYGQRSDPYAVMSRLGERLEETPAPEQVLPALVETIASTLKLPYSAIEFGRGERFEPAASHGRLAGEPLALPLVYQGQPVGRLLLGPRAPGETFSAGELRLFDDLARQAGVAAYAVRLTADLQHSRARLVSSREEERRRLRRDLHDGLGPLLAGVSLQLDAARNLVGSDPAAADALLQKLAGETQAAIADIRRLVYDLRPPALDELGLGTALRQQAARFASSVNDRHQPLTVSFEAPDELGRLPAAVEVAAYRIVTEALTNVARHARARTCTVRVAVNGALELEVLDDGSGFAPDCSVGVGLASIRERTAELGGTCAIGPGPAGGTLVRARLPLPEA